LIANHDGRLKKVMMGPTLDSRGLEPLNQIPLVGFVNGLAIGPKARFAVVAVGQEPRLGRWNRIAKVKNRFGIVRLRVEDDKAFSEEEEYNSSTANSDTSSSAANSDEDESSEDGSQE